MIKLNIHEAKTHLSEYLVKLQAGETILLCRRNTPVAEIRPVETAPAANPRPIGLAKDRFQVPETFFEELPTEIADMFEGKDG